MADFDKFLPKHLALDAREPYTANPSTSPHRHSGTYYESDFDDSSDYELDDPTLYEPIELEPELQAIKDQQEKHFTGRFRLNQVIAKEPEPDDYHESPTPTPTKQKKTQKRRKAKSITHDESDASEDPPAKRKKHTKDARPKVTFYVDVQVPIPSGQAPKGRQTRNQKGPTEETRRLGPFFTANPPSEDYKAFLKLVAVAVQCTPSRLVTAQMEWRYATPKNDQPKPLKSEAGYAAMGLSLEERSKDFVLNIRMPPPLPKEPSWSDDEKENQAYDEVQVVDTTVDMSVKGQIAAIAAAATPIVEQLRQRYPIGGCKEYPDMHVYSLSTGNNTTRWELTPLRLQIWATAIGKGDGYATLTRPPASAHFTYEQRIKAAPAPTAPTPTLAVHPEPHAHLVPPPPPLVPPPPVMSQWPWPYSYPPMPPTYPPNNFAHPGFPPLVPTPTQEAEAPVRSPQLNDAQLAQAANVTMEEFAAHYNLSAADQRAFRAVGYSPGDVGIEDLSPGDWKDADILVLVSKRCIRIHQQFIKDIISGVFV